MDERVLEKLITASKTQLKETHISWILIDEEVYKIKKPLKFSFLDFTTLEKRKFFCDEEVRLNRRLAPDVYLGVSEITDEPAIDGKGKIIEYAVKMKKLNDRMDELLIINKIDEEGIKKIAKIIADFHGKTEIVEGEYGSPKIIAEQINDLDNFKSAIDESAGLGMEVEFILVECAKFIENNKEKIEKRKKDGKVKDCHGDLHSGNIFFDKNEIKIIDCIEFNKDFRCIDMANDIAFLAMDLDAFGREDLSKIFVDEYIRLTGDKEISTLLNLFKCYRANVRAKIAAIEWIQNKNEDSKKRITKYINLASSYMK
ncbi:MAG: gluconokinase [Candidatus Micrarchaeota archaeon]